MKILHGIAISSGIGIGNAKIIHTEKFNYQKHSIKISDVDKEIFRFENSLQHVTSDIDKIIKKIAHTKNNKHILNTHKMMLEDPEFINRVKLLISKELMCLEQAIDHHFSEVVALFNKMDNQYMAERSNDYQDVADRLLAHITNQNDNYFDNLENNSVLFLNDISPSQITKLFDTKIAGIVSSKGSKTSHSSIIARSMNLPVVAGINNLFNIIKQDEIVIIDGYNGEIIIDPTKDILKNYQDKYDSDNQHKLELQEIINVETKTKDGKQIILKCNIEIPEEMEQVKQLNSDGIGLMRTEFLFIDRIDLPNEEEQFKIYKEIVETISPNQLIIRTIDVGGDKLSDVLNFTKESNPNLGCRGIRISLQYPDIFKIQIKAILRANNYGDIAIMFPMISNIIEIRKLKKLINESIIELKRDNMIFDDKIKIGIMIEIPSAAINSDILATECDFFSIGTNDLIQYTLAVDRGNELMIDYYHPTDPAVLKLIQMTIISGRKNNIPVSICGEMASEIDYLKLLIGLEIDELSVSPGKLLAVKKEILNINFEDAKTMAKNILQKSSYEMIKDLILN